MEEQKRTRRVIPKEEKIQKIDEEIAKLEAKLADLRKRKEEIVNPAVNLRDVTTRIKELGLTPDEVMKAIEKLGSKK